jgi:hypothetical protein
LSFSCLLASLFEDIDYLPRIIDVSYDFDNVPFTIKLTYAKPKNPVDATKEIENVILVKEFEFIFNGKEFVGAKTVKKTIVFCSYLSVLASCVKIQDTQYYNYNLKQDELERVLGVYLQPDVNARFGVQTYSWG